MINALTPFKERLSREERGHLIRLNVLKKLKGNNHLDDQLNWFKNILNFRNNFFGNFFTSLSSRYLSQLIEFNQALLRLFFKIFLVNLIFKSYSYIYRVIDHIIKKWEIRTNNRCFIDKQSIMTPLCLK